MMTDWHFATAYEKIADAIPDRPALICDNVVRTWAEFDDRAARIAAVLAAHGLGPNSKVGIYLHNCNEYLEAHHGIFKMRGCPINVNYRYTQEELVYLLNNADAEAIVYLSSYAHRINDIRGKLEKVRCLIQVDGGDNVPLLSGALAYEDLMASASPMPRIDRKVDDLYMLYTGGTTGMPKGVMYTNGGHCQGLSAFGATLGVAPSPTVDDLPKNVLAAASSGILPVGLVCCPLMHGTGMWIGAMITHLAGGTAITINRLGLDPHHLWSEVATHKASLLTIVGDAFARPLLNALDEGRDKGSPYDITSVKTIISSGVMWSKEVKQGLLRHHDMTLIDAMGSTEGGMGSSVTNKDESVSTAKFKLNPEVKVFDDQDRALVPGSGTIGMIATKSAMMGYYKDPEKTAKTVREIDGVRYVFPGDFAQVEADGSITLLGRGSMCINTAGEKVFPEEVEEAIKRHPEVVDCLVVGVPDERFGERVVAVASCRQGKVNETEVIDHCRDHVAGYKLPRQVLLVDHVQRAPNGKADYKWAKATALSMLGLTK
jgi:3-oxocholest-4-en-26-oate---CoA ligase